MLRQARDRYVVEPGSEVKIQKINANEKTLFDDGKDDSYEIGDALKAEIKELQTRLFAQNEKRLLVVIQAMDTGGKDGCVKNVFSSVDPQGIHVEAFKSPTREELAHDYLWRIHSKVPRNGMIAVFNRSHYEDIIAVRVKKLFGEEVWKRRYRHIVEFERMLVEEGTTIVKIFLRISKDEQQERLQARLDDPNKHWKFNPDDLLDRAQWDTFMHAYEEMIERTSTEHAPWYIVPADRKWYRNLVVSQIIIDTMKEMGLEYPEITWDPGDVVIK